MSDEPKVQSDPRHRNEFSGAASVSEFVIDYADRYGRALKAMDMVALEKAIDLVSTAARNGRRIYSIGNGGSAAISDHLCCDFTKGTYCDGHPTIAAQSMNANVALYTAIANDFGFEQVFERQVDFVGEEGDVLMAISSSGNSENIIKAVRAARARNMSSIGLSGFSGGKLAEECDVSLHVNENNYGIVEDCHQSIMHVMAQVIARRRDGDISW